MRAFGIFAALAAVSSVFAAPMPAQPKALVARDVSVSVNTGVTVDLGLTCLINDIHTKVVTIKTQVDGIVSDTTTTVDAKVSSLTSVVQGLVGDIVTWTTKAVLVIGTKVVGVVTGAVSNVDSTVDNTLATVGATVTDILNILAAILVAILTFLKSIQLSVVVAALIAILKTLILVVNTLLSTIFSVAGSLKTVVTVSSFTDLVTATAQAAGVTLPQ